MSRRRPVRYQVGGDRQAVVAAIEATGLRALVHPLTDDDLVAIQDNDVNGGDEVIDIDVTGGVGADPEEQADAPDADLAAVSPPAEDAQAEPEPVDDTGDDIPDAADAADDLTADDALPV